MYFDRRLFGRLSLLIVLAIIMVCIWNLSILLVKWISGKYDRLLIFTITILIPLILMQISGIIATFWSVDLKRYRWALAESDKRARQAFTIRTTDGLIVGIMKFIFSFEAFWHTLIYTPVMYSNLLIARWILYVGPTVTPARQRSSHELRRAASELYMIQSTAWLMLSYVVVLRLVQTPQQSYFWVMIYYCAVGYATHRVYEILAVMIGLHAVERYETPAPMRALFNLFWHYCELVVAFAIVYIVFATYSGDINLLKKLIANDVSSFYFSLVTIATVGYGDMTPERSVLMLIVIFEVIVGFIILLVALQRVLAVSAPRVRVQVVVADSPLFLTEDDREETFKGVLAVPAEAVLLDRCEFRSLVRFRNRSGLEIEFYVDNESLILDRNVKIESLIDAYAN